ncbi:MAG: hypothetical protein HC898_02710 [Phycisphaerales bacterium]|nr:hypothetical protein [Phycisphaerales bacterium]
MILIVCFAGTPAMVGSIVQVQVERAAPLALFGVLATNEANRSVSLHQALPVAAGPGT